MIQASHTFVESVTFVERVLTKGPGLRTVIFVKNNRPFYDCLQSQKLKFETFPKNCDTTSDR
jgi:hypothetical protein